MGRITYLEYSNRDLKAAEVMLEAGLHDHAGRLSQQVVEKRFKHYIELRGDLSDMRIFATHNLGKLYRRICQLADVPLEKEVKGDLAELTDYYFDTNYPQEHGNIELTEEMAESAVVVAKEMAVWVDELLERL